MERREVREWRVQHYKGRRWLENVEWSCGSEMDYMR
jgi:hypothetical protein